MRYLLMVLALAGVVVASLALQVHYSTETEPCSINEKWDCGIVNHSPYAEMAHVPVAAIGIAGYVLMGGLALQKRRRHSRHTASDGNKSTMRDRCAAIISALCAFNAAIWSGVNLDAGQTVRVSPSSIQTDTPALRSSVSRCSDAKGVTGDLRLGLW